MLAANDVAAPQAGATGAAQAAPDFLLELADTALILGQRNAEWCGHAPVIEEDLAMANVSLDLIGQARMLYQCAAARINADAALSRAHAHLHGARDDDGGVTEDTLAYFRDVTEFRNPVLAELPHHGPLAGTATDTRDWATAIVRNFLHSAFMVGRWQQLAESGDADLAAIAARSIKEARYHLRHARDWLVRLGDGTDESRRRAQAAVDHLLPYAREYWQASPAEQAAAAAGVAPLSDALRADWEAVVADALAEATLERPADPPGWVPQGKQGVHSEHLGYVLALMQSLARAHPTARW